MTEEKNIVISYESSDDKDDDDDVDHKVNDGGVVDVVDGDDNDSVGWRDFMITTEVIFNDSMVREKYYYYYNFYKYYYSF